MEFKIKGNLRIKINKADNTASIVKSPKATGNIIIPRFAEHEKKLNTKISTIGQGAFESCKIESLTFSEDSEVETFEKYCFDKANIDTLEIGSNVKNLQSRWCNSISSLKTIKVSPKNRHFIIYENKFLLGKDETGNFNVLYYAIDDKELIIPRQVSIIRENAFDNHVNLQTVKFSPNSKIKCIEKEVFHGSSIMHLSLPASIEKICDSAFYYVLKLQKIEISPENKYFKLINGDYIVKESKIGSGIFDVIVFVRRDIESIKIPSHIKVIDNHAFEYCNLLKKITFDPNSSLEEVKELAFYHSFCPEKLVLPPSLKSTGNQSFSGLQNTKSIVFLGKSVEINSICFSQCPKISTVTFPNAEEVIFLMYAFMSAPKQLKFFVKKGAKISGNGLNGFESRISYIEDGPDYDGEEPEYGEDGPDYDEEEPESGEDGPDYDEEEPESGEDGPDYDEEEPETSKEKETTSNAKMKELLAKLQKSEEENKKLKEENKKLNEDNKKLKQKIKNLEEKSDTKEQVKGITPPKLELFEPEMIDGLKVVKTIGRGGQSEVFEVTRDQRLALKVLFIKGINKSGKSSTTTSSNSSSFKQLQRFLQEYEILSSFSHTNIIKTFGFCYGDSNHSPSILLELCEQNLNDRIINMNDIEKVCCIIEICQAMEIVHMANMIHRDLKPENVLFDSDGHVKISDFGVACIVDVEGQTQSKTSGVGTLKFMAPELLNESTKYDNKVDIYSFGVVLFFILSGGKMPKISMAEQCLGKMAPIPSKINKVAKELIKSCWSKSPSDRPSFTEILNIIKKNKFKLIDGVEKNVSAIKSFVKI